jgi:malonyl-CoA/methylmalonyl-CoA synthetase
MLFLPRLDAKKILELMPRATVMMGVPTFYTRLLKEPGLTREDAAHMRLFVSGSAPLLAETHREWEHRTGHAILERYGMTETNMNTSNPYEGRRRAGTVGFPLPGVTLRVDPETGAPLGPGGRHDRGQGPERVPGLLADAGEDRPSSAATASSSPAISARSTRGLRPHRRPRQGPHHHRRLQRLSQGDRDRDRRASGRRRIRGDRLPHPDFGEGVTAGGGAGQGRNVDEASVLRPWRAAGQVQVPKRVLFDELPRNAMGKVQKNLLREAYADLYRG